MLGLRLMWLRIRPSAGFRSMSGFKLSVAWLAGFAALACGTGSSAPSDTNTEPEQAGGAETPSSVSPPGAASSGATASSAPSNGTQTSMAPSPPSPSGAGTTEAPDATASVDETSGEPSTTSEGHSPDQSSDATGNTAGASSSEATTGSGMTPSQQTEMDPALTSTELVASMGLGWNLGNSLDAPEGETAWGNPLVARELLQAVAAEGFGVVRIPVTWSLHLGGAPGFAIDPGWMARVEEVAGYVVDAGMIAIINVHHDGADGYEGVEWLTLNDANGAISEENNARVEAQFVAVWEQISAHFSGWGHRLVFESMNEIHDGYDAPDPGYYDIINHLNQVFVDIIRNSGGNNLHRHLVVPGYNTNIEYTLEGFEPPQDSTPDKLILSVHYYDPWSFAGEGSTNTWGASSPNADAWGQEDWVVSQFDQLQTRYVNQGLPVIIGEYGAIQQTGFENYRRYYMEYVTKAAHDRGLVPIYWDNGGVGSGPDKFALFDRSSHEVIQPELLQAMSRAVSMSYALEDVALP